MEGNLLAARAVGLAATGASLPVSLSAPSRHSFRGLSISGIAPVHHSLRGLSISEYRGFGQPPPTGSEYRDFGQPPPKGDATHGTIFTFKRTFSLNEWRIVGGGWCGGVRQCQALAKGLGF